MSFVSRLVGTGLRSDLPVLDILIQRDYLIPDAANPFAVGIEFGELPQRKHRDVVIRHSMQIL